MRIDDIFEAMTDIDDRFIEAARPLEPLHDGQPVSVAPAPRRARWKTIVPAAACIAAALTTAAVGGKYLYTKSLTAATNNSSLTFWYPEEAKYRVNGDVLLNCTSYTEQFGMLKNKFLIEENCAEDYAELAAQSDLIVAGEFVDAPHQIQDPEEIHLDQSLSFVTEEYSAEGSYNYLSVERVLKGDAEAGNFVLIRQEASLHKSSGGAYILFANDLLSPMIKGDKWVYFLKKTENGFYTPVNGPQGRYPMPENNNTGVSLEDDVKDDIDEFGALKGSPAANRAEIYAELIEVLNTENSPEIKQIGVPGESFATFTIEEFEGVEFKVSRLGVTADDVEVFSMGDGQLDNLILADLNGDGKRELCATITEDTRSRAVVRDFAGGGYYTLGGKREYILLVKDNVLNVNEHMWASLDLSTMSIEPLTLDKMLRTIPNKDLRLITLDDEDTFCLEEYPDIPFRASESGVTVDETQFGYSRHVIFGGVELEKLFLADITGDGKRELIALGSCNGEPETLAHNIDTGETRIISGTAGYTVYGNDGMLVTLNGELLTFDMMPKTDTMDYSKVSLEHHGAFTLPDFEEFRFEVNKGYFTSLRIDYDYSGGSLGTGTHASEVYFCDIDGDGHREIVTNSVLNSEDETGVKIFDVMYNEELGAAVYEGRVIEENGRLLLESASGVSELKYSKSDLKPLTPPHFYDIPLDEDFVLSMVQGTSRIAKGYRVETKSGRLIISKDGETVFESANDLGELYVLDEYGYAVFVFTDETNGCIDAFILNEQTRKLVCLDEAKVVGAAPTDGEDAYIDFKDGRIVSLNNILSLVDD